MRRALTAAFALAALVAGCGSGERDVGGSDPLTVFAASSLTEVFPKLEPGARYSFAGSDDLAAQIEEGAPADVYASASTKYGDALFADRLVEKPRVFATNRLVLVIPKDNPRGIESVEDLRADGVKLVVGAEGVPVGDYTRTVLESLGASDVLANVVSNEDDVKGVVGKVADDEADAGFVYATDVAPVGGDVRSIPLPARAQTRVEYSIAVVKGARHPEAARAFVADVLSDPGRDALQSAGFGVP